VVGKDGVCGGGGSNVEQLATFMDFQVFSDNEILHTDTCPPTRLILSELVPSRAIFLTRQVHPVTHREIADVVCFTNKRNWEITIGRVGRCE